MSHKNRKKNIVLHSGIYFCLILRVQN